MQISVTDGWGTVYPEKYAHGFCFAVLCCGYTLTDFPISIRLTSLALWQSNDCPSASKATLMNMDKYLWINTCEFIMNDCITTTKQSTTKPSAYFLGYTVFLFELSLRWISQDLTVHPNKYAQTYLCQAITQTNAVLLSNGPLETNFIDISIQIVIFSFKEMCLNVSSVKWQHFVQEEMS